MWKGISNENRIEGICTVYFFKYYGNVQQLICLIQIPNIRTIEAFIRAKEDSNANTALRIIASVQATILICGKFTVCQTEFVILIVTISITEHFSIYRHFIVGSEKRENDKMNMNLDGIRLER